MRMVIPAVVLTIALASHAAGRASKDAFPDTHDNHWAYVTITALHKEGLFFDYPCVRGRGDQARSRYEFAAIAHAAAQTLHVYVAELSRENQRIAQGQPATGTLTATLERRRKSVPHLAKGISELLDFFWPELRSLGVDHLMIRRQVRMDSANLSRFKLSAAGEALQPFSDVPAKHWASEATKNLRVSGVLVGYGNGKYGG